MSPSSLRVVAIHNGELSSAPAVEVLNALAPLAVGVLEEEAQESWPETPDVEELVRWRRNQKRLESRWSGHLGKRRKPVVAEVGVWNFHVRLRLLPQFRSRSWFARNVEKAVTAKHIRAWDVGLRTGSLEEVEELLVLESDASFQEAAISIIQALMKHPSDRPRYVNLAGGLPLEKIGIAGVPSRPSSIDPRLREFSSLVTNTSCAYVINRAMVEVLQSHLHRRPEDQDLGIDWLFNSAFLEVEPGSAVCLHADPPVLLHGSFAGITSSWHPDR